MLNYLFPGLLTQIRRQWAYAIGEVVSIAVFGISSSVAMGNRAYRIGMADPGMARITAICFMAVSGGLFVVATCLKRIDRNE